MQAKGIYAALALALAAAGAQAADLTVVLENAAPNGGQVRAAIYNGAADFLKKPLQGKGAPAPGASVTLVFKDLPAGDYAVTAFQDTNGNQKLDTSSAGLPQEPYGMSNGARGSAEGPPKFSDAAFHMDGNMTVKVKLK